MEAVEMQQLIADYALDILDDEERIRVEDLLETDVSARVLFSELQLVLDSLNLSVAPQPLPPGSLSRLRAKAGINNKVGTQVEKVNYLQAVPSSSTNERVETTRSQNTKRKYWSKGRSWGGWAVAAVLTITTLTFGWLWLDTSSQQNKTVNQNQQLVALLAAPNLKVTELKPISNLTQATMRLYNDPNSSQVYLVAQNLNPLPSGKEYEAWFITLDNQSQKAGVLGTGGGAAPSVFNLVARSSISQYQKVAITIEPQGGSEKPTTEPIMTGLLMG